MNFIQTIGAKTIKFVQTLGRNGFVFAKHSSAIAAIAAADSFDDSPNIFFGRVIGADYCGVGLVCRHGDWLAGLYAVGKI